MPLPRFANLDSAKRSEILRVATEEFVEQGFENASLNRIIARSGMSKGALYYYFSDKDDLYRTILDEYAEQLIAVWSGGSSANGAAFAGVRTPGRYWAAWLAHWRRSLEHHKDNPLYSAFFGQCVRARASGLAHPALTDVATSLRGWVREVLRRGQRIGAVRDDLPEDLLLEAAFGLMEGFDRWLVRHRQTANESPIDDLARLSVEFLQRLVEPDPPRSHARKTRGTTRGRHHEQP